MTLDRRSVLIGSGAAAAVVFARGLAVAQPIIDTSATVVRLDPELDAVIAPDAKITRVATGFIFTEGPMWREGRLWFSDLRGDKMLAVTPEGKVSVLIDHVSGLAPWPPHADWGSNAMVPDKHGGVLMVQQGQRTIVRLDRQLKIHSFLSKYDGKKFNSPNDLVFAQDGALWFTDPPFGLLGMDKSPLKELPFNGVFRYAEGRLTAPITDLTQPNGIGFSPDGRTLYVSNYGPKMYVMAYDVGPGGALSNSRKLIDYPNPVGKGGPDGLKVDMAGNIWTTGPGGPRIITPEGKVLGQINLPEVDANIAFADGGRTVYFAASTSIYRLHTKIPGEMPMYSR